MNYKNQLSELLGAHDHVLSRLKPSDWAELNRIMSGEVSNFPGKFNFDLTPYLREPLDCLSAEHDARIIAVMKGAQIGFSTGVIENAIGYIIAQQPGNILFLTGDKDLAQEAITGKVDQMLDSTGLRSLIRPHTIRKRNQRTGDTSKGKEFPGGTLIAGSTQNANKLRQRSMRYGMIDDFEAAPTSDKSAGSITSLIEMRFAAYYTNMKLYYISTPELKNSSNIEPVYKLGDQRRYNVPCPKCNEHIPLYWSIPVDDKENAGIHFKVDDKGHLIDNSVGYICQLCGEFFTDKKKRDLLINGYWVPTAKPSELGYYSYHISSLYAPVGMYDWEHYARKFLEAMPPNAPVNIAQLKTFYNTVLGNTWEERGESPKASKLAGNTREYRIDEVPDVLSEQDGNGQIIMLTCACDLNGTLDDARLDFEIVAWSESGASYSVKHGSVGTFIPREGSMKEKVDRKKWTYEHGYENSVWPVFQQIVLEEYTGDSGKKYSIWISGVDTGFQTLQSYEFLDNKNGLILGLKGRDSDKYRRYSANQFSFVQGKERDDLYLLDVNQIKDELAEQIKLKWSADGGLKQPPGFMNFPQPTEGLYTMKNFFSHFESEHRIQQKNTDGDFIASKWVKRNTTVQNHLWDCRIYNIALKEILTSMVCRENGIKYPSWKTFIDYIKGQ